jgi:hypothetical protein
MVQRVVLSSLMLLLVATRVPAQFGNQGCALLGGTPDGMRLAVTTCQFPGFQNCAALDAAFMEKYARLVNLLGVRPSLLVFDDTGAENAFATPNSLIPGPAQGSVVFGINLMNHELQRNPTNFTIPGIMAHEFGHIVQFTRGISLPTMLAELQADYIAGWCLRQVDPAWSNLAIRQGMEEFYRLGDYQFNNPTHHGTPDERTKALSGGLSDTRSLTA